MFFVTFFQPDPEKKSDTRLPPSATSNDVYRARRCHTACSYRVASLRNKHLALKTKEQEMKQRWQPKILVIQDEISLVPAAVENMMLTAACAPVKMKALIQPAMSTQESSWDTYQFC